jgi:plastocyanin
MRMLSSVILGVAVCASGVYGSLARDVAERGYYTTNAELGVSPTAPAPSTMTILVGGTGRLSYTPEFVNADVGTVLEFQFDVVNHTVTQSSFNEPCVHSNGMVP